MSIGKGRPLKKLTKRQLLSKKMLEDVNTLIEFYNAFINGEITRGTANELLIGDRKILWHIKEADATGQSAVSQYRGEYTPDGLFTEFNPGPYVFGDIVRITPGNVNATTGGGDIIPGVYICVQDGPTSSDLPNHPLSDGGETEFWHWLSTYPTIRQMCDDSGVVRTVFVDAQNKP